jgi:hypothetical protein
MRRPKMSEVPATLGPPSMSRVVNAGTVRIPIPIQPVPGCYRPRCWPPTHTLCRPLSSLSTAKLAHAMICHTTFPLQTPSLPPVITGRPIPRALVICASRNSQLRWDEGEEHSWVPGHAIYSPLVHSSHSPSHQTLLEIAEARVYISCYTSRISVPCLSSWPSRPRAPSLSV